LIKELCDDNKDSSAADLFDEDVLGGDFSDLSAGYHSDSESCVMTSGNSPFISKEARYNFLSRSGRKWKINYDSCDQEYTFSGWFLESTLKGLPGSNIMELTFRLHFLPVE
jgi:hypothetical protein